MDELLNLVPLKGNKFNHKKEKERREGEWPEDIINTSAQTVAIAIFHRVQLTRQFNPTLQLNTFFLSKQTATPSLLHFTTFHLLFQTTLYFSNHLHKFAHSLDTPGASLVRYVLWCWLLKGPMNILHFTQFESFAGIFVLICISHKINHFFYSPSLTSKPGGRLTLIFYSHVICMAMMAIS